MFHLLPRIRALPSTTRLYYSTFKTGPSPPRLPAEQQAEFERLQRASAVSSAFQPPEPTTPVTQQPRHASDPTAAASKLSVDDDKAGDVNQGLFRGAPPEFEGDVNPKTGEVGGPKNEPLRWGHQGDWSYNGRVTDF